jgi:CheY-like chemotaxis protein
MNGIEFLEQLRDHPPLNMIPVVILTSSREQSDLTRCYELGVNAYVVKPLRTEDFVEAMKALGIFWTMVNENPDHVFTEQH